MRAKSYLRMLGLTRGSLCFSCYRIDCERKPPLAPIGQPFAWQRSDLRALNSKGETAIIFSQRGLLVDFPFFEGCLVPLNSHFKLGKCLGFISVWFTTTCLLSLSFNLGLVPLVVVSFPAIGSSISLFPFLVHIKQKPLQSSLDP